MTITTTQGQVALGLGIPAFTPHAISVSLPTWRDNVAYEEGDKRVVDVMVSGYPRFFIGLNIRKLAEICANKFGVQGEQCMLFPSKNIAEQCREFVERRSALEGTPFRPRLVQFLITPEDNAPSELEGASADLHIALYPSAASGHAKQFWQHTGLGISSRLADYCLAMLKKGNESPTTPPLRTKPSNRHYAAKGFAKGAAARTESIDDSQSNYLEERYGRNLPLAYGPSAKRALRRRIAGVLEQQHVINTSICEEPAMGVEGLAVGPSSRISEMSESDVFLFPTGMSAIYNAHRLATALRPAAKSVCFGFPYTDTLKILEKWGPGCHFYGTGLDAEIADLEAMLEKQSKEDPSRPPILSLFTEFPSNPLLRSANLPRLRALADKYDFLIIIDESIGNFMNVEILPYADAVVSSLTKIFSGAANCMGGSMTLNPRGRHYAALKARMQATYEDTYFDQDAIFLERNSRDSLRRIRSIDENTEAVCDYLRSRSIAGGASDGVIKQVYYPKYTTPENYELCRIQDGGFGGLFSVTFTSLKASEAFFDALPFLKGPSLGTNFTLASPYAVLAHFAELPWAAQYDVEEGLVRVSVGLEAKDVLLESTARAVKAAEEASR
ncbi:PLP-dependent transferase [Cylindrobasidium torrendii FP15055 ss-10]|uniref:PLP-dependent transferase n=1 Tax=Cylindrobasidium torrendii FP15055 ss-10 TaxID=1314674 RepID=A0A0D7BFG1_9AGAR|nr:PLP-dependent transferase [Cylindrobasidium torrendii FP15055 ss-10]